jgi:hypothetical protein
MIPLDHRALGGGGQARQQGVPSLRGALHIPAPSEGRAASRTPSRAGSLLRTRPRRHDAAPEDGAQDGSLGRVPSRRL